MQIHPAVQQMRLDCSRVNTTPMSGLCWLVPEGIGFIVKDWNCHRAVQHYLHTGWHVSVRAGRFVQVMFKYNSRSQPNTADSESQYSPVLCCRFLVAMSSKCQLPVRLLVSFWWNQSLISDRRAAARVFRLMLFSVGIFSYLSQSLWLPPRHFRVCRNHCLKTSLTSTSLQQGVRCKGWLWWLKEGGKGTLKLNTFTASHHAAKP